MRELAYQKFGLFFLKLFIFNKKEDLQLQDHEDVCSEMVIPSCYNLFTLFQRFQDYCLLYLEYVCKVALYHKWNYQPCKHAASDNFIRYFAFMIWKIFLRESDTLISILFNTSKIHKSCAYNHLSIYFFLILQEKKYAFRKGFVVVNFFLSMLDKFRGLLDQEGACSAVFTDML